MAVYRLFAWCCSLFLLLILWCFIVVVRQDGWLESDLQAVLPKERAWSSLQKKADALQNAYFEKRLVALVSAKDLQGLWQNQKALEDLWQESALFSNMMGHQSLDLSALREATSAALLAIAPEVRVAALKEDGALYFKEQLLFLLNPFQATLLSASEDLFGLSRNLSFADGAKWQFDAETGRVYLFAKDKFWAPVEGMLVDDVAPSDLLDLLRDSKIKANVLGGDFLATGARVFAAHAQLQGAREGVWFSVCGASLTFLLLFLAFRTWRVVLVFVPIVFAVMAGLLATKWFFGEVHVLTLVVASTLLGVLIDFPLHWLGASLGTHHWCAFRAMWRLRFAFFVSLLVTFFGYFCLLFADLPVLRQSAVFAMVALWVALLATFLLPIFFQKFHGRSLGKVVRWASFCGPFLRIKTSAVFLALLAVFLALFAHWQDDIRQWVRLDEEALNEASVLSDLLERDFSSHYFLILADSDEALLAYDAHLSAQLEELKASGALVDFRALSHYWRSEKAQVALQKALLDLGALEWQAFLEAGFSEESLRAVAVQLAEKPTLSLKEGLAMPWARVWQDLYLGRIDDGVWASLLRVEGVRDEAVMARLGDGQRIFWHNPVSEVSKAFASAREEAFLLKVLSLVCAFLLFWRLFGFYLAVRLLMPAVGAVLATMAVFVFFGWSLGIFALFGLLLVSAIALDYALFMFLAPEVLFKKRLSLLLLATTTCISFALLALSKTPALADFGASVALGTIFSLVFVVLFFNAEVCSEKRV